MTTQAELLSKIEAFLKNRKMAETTFGRLAVNDGKLVARLRAGANITISTISKVTEFIERREAA